VKIQCRALAPRCGKWPFEADAIQIYDHGRYFTVTGRSAGVLTIAGHQRDVEPLIEDLDEDRSGAAGESKARFWKGQPFEAVSLAGTMHRRGMYPESIEAALQEVNLRRWNLYRLAVENLTVL
jgi:hypothetical protein